MNRLAAIGLLVLSALLWSTGGVLIKSVAWTPLGIAGGRSAIAAAVLLLALRKLKLHRNFAQWGGAIAYAGTVILFVLANRATTSANAILLQFTAPVYVAIFGSWYLGERTSRQDLITIALAFIGMALFFFDDLHFDHLWGNLAAVASGVCFAWLVLFLRKQKEGSPIESIILGNILAALVCLPFASAAWPEGKSLALLLLLGVGQLALPYFLYSKAIRHVTAIEAITVTFVEPILNPIWALLILGERPGTLALMGGAIILGAVVMRAIVRR